MPNQGVGSRPGRVRPLCRCGQPKAVTKSGRRQDACAVCLKARVTAWCAANRERRLDISRRSGRKAYAADPEKAKAAVRAWSKANPDKVREMANRQYRRRSSIIMGKRADSRAKRAGAQQFEPIRDDEWRARLEEFGYACAYCRRAGLTLCRDHVIALARAGAHTIDNVVPACRSCNSRKSKRPVWVMAGL